MTLKAEVRQQFDYIKAWGGTFVTEAPRLWNAITLDEDTVRLTPEQINAITLTISRLTGGTAEVFLFGSRLDDRARGGDVDLLIETVNPLALVERARIKMELEPLISLPIDIVSQVRDSAPTPFQRIVRANAVKLEAQ